MSHTVEIDLHGSKDHSRDRKDCQTGQRFCRRSLGRFGVVFVTACANEEPKAGANFFPLTVDYREYTYAAGKFPGRLYQARRHALGKGSPYQPAD